MIVDELRVLRDASPFCPFTIRVADGRSFRVHHRDYLLISPRGRTMHVYNEDGEAISILDILLVTELTVETPAPTPGTPNGSV
jgi:hypothetical protein